jgi:hypothetical protein
MSTVGSGDDTPRRWEVLMRAPGAPGPTVGAWVVVVGARVVEVVDVVVVGAGNTEKEYHPT